MRRRYSIVCWLVLTTIGLTPRGHAAVRSPDCRSASADCVAVGHWYVTVSLGAGVRTNPLVQGKDIPLLVIPQFSYYGKRAFIDNLDVGFTLFDHPVHSLSLLASPGYDRVFFFVNDPQNIFVSPGNEAVTVMNPAAPDFAAPPSRSRQFTYLAGLEWALRYHALSGQLDLLHEVTGHHHGNEIRAALALPLLQSRNAISVAMGFTWKSATIVNYYYGAPGFYEAGAALNPFLKFAFIRPLSDHWNLKAFVHGERLGNAIAGSPFVARQYVTTVFAGATYRF